MKLNDSIKRDYLSTASGDEKTTKMSISADVESHIVRVLTEHTYSDPLGSAIRECVSNAVDSVTEAGTNLPVIVRIQKNKSNLWELSVEDKGLGLDDASFKKYIMGIGESTKRNSNVLLGGYGAGAKAWLAYTDTFVYTCRKDGIERKYVIFKGEEFPESTLIRQVKTTEPNGVIVTVILKNEYRELETCKAKIHTQLSYLDNVWFDIPDFDNTIPIYRSEHFQYKGGNHQFSEMHISLKNIYYKIDWDKLGIKSIDIPIALRFDDYEEIKPVFNREQINWNSTTAEAIRNKLQKVSDWFITKWNTEFNTHERNIQSLQKVRHNYRNIDMKLKGKDEVDVEPLEKHASVKLDPYKFNREFTFQGIGWLLDNGWSLSKFMFQVVACANATYVRSKNDTCWNDLNDLKSQHRKLILIDFDLKGYMREYLLQKHRGKPFFVVKADPYVAAHFDKLGTGYSRLGFSAFSQEQQQAAIKDIQTLQEMLIPCFIDERGLNLKEEFLDYVKRRKEEIRETEKAKGNSRYLALDKQKNEITTYTGRVSLTSDTMVAYDKGKIAIEDLRSLHRLVVYSCEKLPEHWILLSKQFPKVSFIRFNVSEVKHVKDLPGFITKEQFMTSKPLARLATALYINSVLKADPPHVEIVSDSLTRNKDLRNRLHNYVNDNLTGSVPDNLAKLILDDAKERNNWDLSIYKEATQYEHEMKRYRFLRIINATQQRWYLNEVDRKTIQNVAYIMYKHQKLTSTLIDDCILVEQKDMPEDKVTSCVDAAKLKLKIDLTEVE